MKSSSDGFSRSDVLPARIQVVCLAVGDAPDEYVVKLQSMLSRHMPVPFDLACIVDRLRPLPSSIQQIDASAWPRPRAGMRMTTYKLNLFDSVRVPFESFLYLDTSVVIHRDMGPLLEYAYGRPEELVVRQDWNYDAFNTCVMRIRPGGDLQAIPRAYESGVAYEQAVPGDQDFVTAFIREHCLCERVAEFPEEMIASYKTARKLSKRSRSLAKETLNKAAVVKFHGEPKMHQLLDPRFRLKLMWEKRRPWHRNAWFWIRELREDWR